MAEKVDITKRKDGRWQNTCSCTRYRFPHRYQYQSCRPEDVEIDTYPLYRTDVERQYWADYHDRVRDLRRELA